MHVDFYNIVLTNLQRAQKHARLYTLLGHTKYRSPDTQNIFPLGLLIAERPQRISIYGPQQSVFPSLSLSLSLSLSVPPAAVIHIPSLQCCCAFTLEQCPSVRPSSIINHHQCLTRLLYPHSHAIPPPVVYLLRSAMNLHTLFRFKVTRIRPVLCVLANQIRIQFTGLMVE